MKTMKVRAANYLMGSLLLAGLVSLPLLVKADEPHHNPKIHHALEALHDARDEISTSKHDFHGEKQAALEEIDRAIERLDKIKEYEN